MEPFLKITGKHSLEGEIKVSGAKNAITKLLVASLLSNKPCTFYNVPNIADVEITLSLCQEIGMEVDWDRSEKTLRVITKKIKTSYVPQRFSGSNRIPILMLGVLLARTQEDVIVPTSGGCILGKRPVDFHISALQALGAEIEYRDMKTEGAYFARVPYGLTGATIELPYPSVGATENAILAAVRAKGITVIKNAAIEPEIMDLILFLQKLGASITFNADRVIQIEGVHTSYEVEHTVISDRNEVASFAMAAIATKGRVFIEGAQHIYLIPFLNKIQEIGGRFHVRHNGIEFFYENPLKGNIHIETDVYPGFMTDWQQPFVVLLTQAEGVSVIHETVYENRFGYIDALKNMGANVQVLTHCLGGKACRYHGRNHRHSAVVYGATSLKAGKVVVPDLRAGFAYVMAALVAEGESEITGLHFLMRGYEDLVQKLKNLGAQIEVVYPNSKQENLSSISVELV